MLYCNWLASMSGTVTDTYVVSISCHLSGTYINHVNQWNGWKFYVVSCTIVNDDKQWCFVIVNILASVMYKYKWIDICLKVCQNISTPYCLCQ